VRLVTLEHKVQQVHKAMSGRQVQWDQQELKVQQEPKVMSDQQVQ